MLILVIGERVSNDNTARDLSTNGIKDRNRENRFVNCMGRALLYDGRTMGQNTNIPLGQFEFFDRANKSSPSGNQVVL